MRVVLYLRLSDEDHDKLSKEELSESIKNQEKMLTQYAIENNWDIVGIYQDEDYSGADRDRPNFKKMIEECKNGNVDIVLVKTQSRFARDIELIDKYVHNKFYEWNVRFITYLEKIDNTKRETKKTSQITSMVDEWYVEDTSINIRATLKAKRENGEFTGSFAPYGYQKNPENKNHLIIDPIVSPIIKRIYSDFLKGHSLSKIANNFNHENILSPLEYKKLIGCKLNIPLLKNENISFIKQVGSYKMNIFYSNERKDKLKNITSYQYLSTTSDKFIISLTDYTTDKIELYYTTNNKDWKKLSKNKKIESIKKIAIHIKELSYKQSFFYELDIDLKENRKHLNYYFLFEHYFQKSKIDLTFQTKLRKKYKWSIQTIKNILTNEIYVGNLVQFKSTHVSYKNHTVIHNSKSKWIRSNNTHEAIIDMHIWNQVQDRLNFKARSKKNGNISPLANKVFCEECQKSFMKCGKIDSDGYGYLCCRDKLEKWKNCNNKKYVNEKQLHTFILKKINQFILKHFDKKEWEKLETKYLSKAMYSKKNFEKEFLEKELQKRNEYFIKLYENYSNGNLNQKEFALLKTKYQDEIEKINNRINSIQKIKKRPKEKDFHLELKYLDNTFINTFIHRIVIGSYNEEKNSREITIEWDLHE